MNDIKQHDFHQLYYVLLSRVHSTKTQNIFTRKEKKYIRDNTVLYCEQNFPQ